jgi:hypothetical protein
MDREGKPSTQEAIKESGFDIELFMLWAPYAYFVSLVSTVARNEWLRRIREEKWEPI